MARVLIVEDQKDLADVLGENLEADGHRVRTVGLAVDGREAVEAWRPDLLVLDLMLPDESGETVLRHVRRSGLTIPVLILSALGDVRTKVKGLRQGADDYVTKPFSLMEFLARVESLLRRSMNDSLPDRITLGSAVIHPRARRLEVDGDEVLLRPREMELLLALVARRNQAVPRATLLAEVWGYSPDAETRTVDWHVASLRRKLERDPAHPMYLRTVRAVGYRLDVPEGQVRLRPPDP